ncbi:UDP-N-acetylmuramoyl-L-alanyl-D-glutamate--2,6-diaminopimelate ligase [Corallincola holothuriorum]|uniref:UDP-N-acetylmuramoyl-L-alanyl-D-glutamate--2,6-diaminopimelate ligase n=2 Tax=Corallincola holothuriorum TaxID=2282215 RepID=A0A368NIE0_9GAMM|nr:UDP-N-acetylmuramoyl-L-alanyl-D-glutamate--2,6-diaminopimelate ligase [Corallincola holothuriorum]
MRWGIAALRCSVEESLMAQLAELLPNYSITLPAISLAQMHLDSRQIRPGDLFAAIPGHLVDGREYIASALTAGAAAILAAGDEEALVWHQAKDAGAVPEIRVPDLARRLPQIAAQFYGEPGQQMKVIGVTGTNGKSSVCSMCAQLAQLCDEQGGVVGTLGWGAVDQLQQTANTTPDCVSVQQMLAAMRNEQMSLVAMEVSSHGLMQGRADAVPFSTAIFTNLSRDHLDYHEDMASYFAAKKRLFSLPSVKRAVINVEDSEGRVLFAELRETLDCCVVGDVAALSELGCAQFIAYQELSHFSDGMRCELSSHWGEASLYLPLIGDFNLRNFLCALAALCVEGYDFQQLVAMAAKLQPAAGRMELIHKPGHPGLVVDYAHTPDALEKALAACRHHCHGQLWCVFGCGGDRDVGKRPLMAKVAEQLADHVVVTADNPRSEPQHQITQDILAGFAFPEQISVVEDRSQAIVQAFSQAAMADLILIAGKGHEDYQLVGKQTLHHDDGLVARRLMEEAL